MPSPLHRAWPLASLASLAAASLVALAGCPAPAASHATTCDGALCGKPAPEIDGLSISGEGPTTMAAAKGTNTIVDFWGTFCEPCKKSFPKYQELLEARGSELNVIAVSVDDPGDATEDDIRKFGADLGVSFPLVWDKDQKTAPLYEPKTMPTSYVIDREGIVRFIHVGYKPDETEVIAKELDSLR